MSNEWISERLRNLRKSKGNLAKALGIDPARVSEVIGGRRNVQVSELPLMADFLEITTAELVSRLAARRPQRPANADPASTDDGEAAQPTPPPTEDGFVARPLDLPAQAHMPRNLPVYGSAMGGTDGVFEINGQILEYVERPPSLAGVKNAYAVYVQGDSMSPRFESGWLLHVNPNRPARRGDNVVVQIKPHDEHAPPLAYVKLFDCLTATKLVARQFNPPRDLEWPTQDVASIHRIVGVAEM